MVSSMQRDIQDLQNSSGGPTFSNTDRPKYIIEFSN